jgi:hypothetical protein
MTSLDCLSREYGIQDQRKMRAARRITDDNLLRFSIDGAPYGVVSTPGTLADIPLRRSVGNTSSDIF